MKIIRDTIHGDIILDDDEVRIIDTKEFQRLRRIKQLGLTYLTYPSANHTRFEHSLGTMYIANNICEKLNLDEYIKRHVRLAALLHDLGHCPLSHTSEEILVKFFGKKHEDLTIYKIENSEIKDLIKERYEYDRIVKILKGEDTFSGIISGTIDSDRLDYILRDSYHTGVAYGVIDLSRIINNVETCDKESGMIFDIKSKAAIEGFLIARYLMNVSVYYHHTTRIAERMLLKAIEINIDEGNIGLEDLIKMDDIDLFSFLRSRKNDSKKLMDMIDSRNLYKRALVLRYKELEEDIIKRIIKIRNDYKKWKEIEEEIAEDLNVNYYEALIDIPRLLENKVNVKIKNGDKIVNIEDLSEISKTLDELMKNIWFVSLYTKKEYVERASKINLLEYFQ